MNDFFIRTKLCNVSHNKVGELAPDNKGNIYFTAWDENIYQVRQDGTNTNPSVVVSVKEKDAGLCGIVWNQKYNTLYACDRTYARIFAYSLDTGNLITLTGNGPAHTDGKLTEAKFININKITTNRSGDLYVTEGGLYPQSHYVRKISLLEGTVSTIAGCGEKGHQDGAAAQAMFRNATGILETSDGTIFVADENHCIRAIKGGNVSTIAGTSGQEGNQDGSLTQAKFKRPCGLSLGADGTILVVDNSGLRSIDLKKQTVSTLQTFEKNSWSVTRVNEHIFVASAGAIWKISEPSKQEILQELGRLKQAHTEILQERDEQAKQREIIQNEHKILKTQQQDLQKEKARLVEELQACKNQVEDQQNLKNSAHSLERRCQSNEAKLIQIYQTLDAKIAENEALKSTQELLQKEIQQLQIVLSKNNNELGVLEGHLLHRIQVQWHSQQLQAQHQQILHQNELDIKSLTEQLASISNREQIKALKTQQEHLQNESVGLAEERQAVDNQLEALNQQAHEHLDLSSRQHLESQRQQLDEKKSQMEDQWQQLYDQQQSQLQFQAASLVTMQQQLHETRHYLERLIANPKEKSQVTMLNKSIREAKYFTMNRSCKSARMHTCKRFAEVMTYSSQWDKLCDILDIARNGWKDLGEALGKTQQDLLVIKKRSKGHFTKTLLQEWQHRKDACVEFLLDLLRDINNQTAVELLESWAHSHNVVADDIDS